MEDDFFIKPDNLKPARKVKIFDLPRVKNEAMLIIGRINRGFKGYLMNVLAISHNQVCADDPLKFFVLHENLGKQLGTNIVVNPQIKRYDGEKMIESWEGCLTWPFRKEKKMLRFGEIWVKFYKPLWGFVLWPQYRVLRGIWSCVFQHEVEHLEGKTIFSK